MLQLLDQLARTWGPLYDFDRLQKDIATALPETFGLFSNGNRAPINIYTGEEGGAILVRLPGWRAEWFDLSVEGNRLYLKGETPKQEGETGDTELETFQRVITLPFRIEPNSMTASYQDGLLTIQFAIHEQEKPKKIHVSVA